MVATRKRDPKRRYEDSDEGPEAEIDQTTPTRKRTKVQSGDDSDYNDEKAPKRGGQLEETRKAKGKGKGKGKTAVKALMSAFFDVLPIDMIWEIFGHLQPLDLLRLSRTSKTLRMHLMTKTSVSLWKGVRLKVDPPIPDCPPDQSEPQWVNLIYTRDCMMCGRGHTVNVDWAHRLRGCKGCFVTNLLLAKKCRKRFPPDWQMELILDILPYSNNGSSWDGRYYYVPEIQKVGYQLEIYRNHIAVGTLGASKSMRDFTATKKSESEEIMEHARICRAWIRNATYLKSKAQTDQRNERRQLIYTKLEELGHNPVDIRSTRVSTHGFVDSATPLTDSRWKVIHKELERLVEAAKQARLERERAQIVDTRRLAARDLYEEFQRDIGPSRMLMPDSSQVMTWAPFADVINHPSATQITRDDFSDAITALPSLIQGWQTLKKRELLGRIPPPVGREWTDADFPVLDLATSIFCCTDRMNGRFEGGRVLHLDRDLGSHFYLEHRMLTRPEKWDFRCFVFDAGASRIVADISRIAGLDPESTTPEDLDRINLRFYCSGGREGDPRLARVARNWRNCAWHCRYHGSTGWTRLLDAEAAAIIALENERAASLSNLTCHHCGRLFSPASLELHISQQFGRDVEEADYHIDPTFATQGITLDGRTENTLLKMLEDEENAYSMM